MDTQCRLFVGHSFLVLSLRGSRKQWNILYTHPHDFFCPFRVCFSLFRVRAAWNRAAGFRETWFNLSSLRNSQSPIKHGPRAWSRSLFCDRYAPSVCCFNCLSSTLTWIWNSPQDNLKSIPRMKSTGWSHHCSTRLTWRAGRSWVFWGAEYIPEGAMVWSKWRVKLSFSVTEMWKDTWLTWGGGTVLCVLPGFPSFYMVPLPFLFLTQLDHNKPLLPLHSWSLGMFY